MAGAVVLAWCWKDGVAVPPAHARGVHARLASLRRSVKPLNLPARLPRATGYATEDYLATAGVTDPAFDQPLCTAFPPGERDRLFVVSKTGVIDVITHLDGKDGPPRRSRFLDINPYLASKNLRLGQAKEWGIMGLAFHPRFAENGYFYITYDFLDTEGDEQVAFDRLARFSVSKADPNKADPDSEVPLITQLDHTPNHNGGCVAFNDGDGYLYYSMGDDGYPRDDQDNARWVDRDFFAALYRIDVDRRPGNLEPNAHAQPSTRFPSAVDKDAGGTAHYKVPADNPLVSADRYMGRPVDPRKVRTEIYAHGLRNPWRFSFDPVTGRLFSSDVGEDDYEEVNIIQKGGDYGWPYREGPEDGPRAGDAPANAKFIDPAYAYPHGDGNACITGGFVYHGRRMPELDGAYVFADYLSGRISAIRERDGKWGPPVVLAENVRTVVNLAPDPIYGDILLTTIGPGAGFDFPPYAANTGRVLRLVRARTDGAGPPPLLSQVGAFKNLQTLEPADGLVAYEPNVSFWSDHAVKRRWFMIPDGSDAIRFDPTGNWAFPTGMVWVKHFDMEQARGDPAGPRRRLETRFLVKTADGVYGVTYRWRPDNSDADLVPELGADDVLTVNDHGPVRRQTWHYPGQGECLQCHTAVAGGALGFNTWQLNGSGHGGTNQIDLLVRGGYFSPDVTVPDPRSLAAYAKADDTTAPLQWRVRSYLGANCVQCHQPGGGAQGLWDARPSTPLAAAGIVNGRLTHDRGDPNNRVIAPGDPAHSMIYQRLQAKSAPRMPPLATNELDPGGQDLIRQWVLSFHQ